MEHNPGVVLLINVKLLDKFGKVVQEWEQEGHSFVRNFLVILYGAMQKNVEGLSIVNTAGASHSGVNTYNFNSTRFSCLAAAADGTYGVVMGTGSTAVSIADYKLQTTPAGLTYGASGTVSWSNDAGNTYSYSGVIRTITNNSGGSLVISEIGLIAKMSWSTTNELILLARDVLGAPVTVPNTSALNISYRIRAYV